MRFYMEGRERNKIYFSLYGGKGRKKDRGKGRKKDRGKREEERGRNGK